MIRRYAKRFLGAALILSTALSAAACSNDSKDGAADSPIRIGVAVDASLAPFYLAEETGMFKDAGLDVNLVQFAAGGEAMQAIAGDQIDLTMVSSVTTETLMAQNADLRAMAVYAQSGKFLKVVVRSDITNPSQINRMAVVPGLSAYMAHKYFEVNDVSIDSVEFVEADPPEIPALTSKGDADAFLLWEPWASKGEELGLKVATDTGSFGYAYAQWLVSTQKWISANDERAQDLVAVIAEAADMVAADPAVAAAAVEAQTTIPAADAENTIRLVDWGVRDFTSADLDSYNEEVTYLHESGALEDPLDIEARILTGWYKS